MDKQKRKHWIRVYAVSAVLLLVIHYVFNLDIFSVLGDNIINLLKKLAFGCAIISIILLIRKVIEGIVIRQTHTKGDQYNMLRIVKLVSITLIASVVLLFLFNRPYASLVSVGVFSLVLGFALQAPITSFIGWLYIVFRRPYQVGQRIQINEHRGDVIDISYLDTTVWECSGDYLGNDRRSGRVVHFPNSSVLKDKVVNYSGPQLPFIWNETPLQIAYTSDLQFVEQCLLEASHRDFKEQYPKIYGQNQEQWQPAVYFRVNEYSWIEAVISYPVEPEDTTGRRNRILRYALPMLNEHPEKVKFPEGTHR